VNGSSKPQTRRTNTLDSQGSGNSGQSNHLALNRVNQLSRKHSDLSGAGSESDSILDYYKQPSDKRNGKRTVSEKRKGSNAGARRDPEIDDSNWIHRDKLAQIESKELEEAGIRLGRISRSNSTTRYDQTVEDEESYGRSAAREEKKARTVSPIPAEDEEPEADEERMHWDFRTPDEIAADRARDSSVNRSSSIRPSGSRIPLAKLSPAPVPYTFVERDSPLPRSREGSGAWGGVQQQAEAFSRARARSASVGSQVLLDDTDDVPPHSPVKSESPTSPIPGSPTRARAPTKTTPTGKKTTSNSRNASASKPRKGSTSGQSPVKRPGTSGGVSRPTTARPEGEAPWIATMYKPDPSLPPDQQIIPTHAKRLAQEQWEKEGKTGTVYDTDFRLLNTAEFMKPTSKKTEENQDDEIKEKDPWPLPSPRSDGRPGTSGTDREHGGYSTMPKISSPQIPQKSPLSPQPQNLPQPKPEVKRVQEPPAEEGTKEKGCCCIIM
jgi:hypothetical protein